MTTAHSTVFIRFINLPAAVTSIDMRYALEFEGNLTYLNLKNTVGSILDAEARFCPAPLIEIWRKPTWLLKVRGKGTFAIRVALISSAPTLYTQSPICSTRRYRSLWSISLSELAFGVEIDERNIMVKRAFKASSSGPMRLEVNSIKQEVRLNFAISSKDLDHERSRYITEHTEWFRSHIAFEQIVAVSVVHGDKFSVIHLNLAHPPRYYREHDTYCSSQKAAENHKSSRWPVGKVWCRQTDLTRDSHASLTAPISQVKLMPIIDYGKWTTLRLTISNSPTEQNTGLHEICTILKDFNVVVFNSNSLNTVEPVEPLVWNQLCGTDVSECALSMDLYSKSTDRSNLWSTTALSFETQYQLEMCISMNIFREHDISIEFITRLSEMNSRDARNLLEFVAEKNVMVQKPTSIFFQKAKGSGKRLKLPAHCSWIRCAVITPTTLYLSSPVIETSNRVLRRYKQWEDRFLRVRFTDENIRSKISSAIDNSQDQVYERVARTLKNGIRIGGRHFRFLAYGNSQLREHGAYFFAPTPELGIKDIQMWMGSFDHIKSVALYASRVGQCFSTTRAVTAQVSVIEIDDIVRNGYNFSDGVGKVSIALAKKISNEIGLTSHGQSPPSVFQFRFGGCKGVLTVWPEIKGDEIHIRESQYKFPASHEGLEIIRWSQYTSAFLNRQLILVLSSLGISDGVFISKMESQLRALQSAMGCAETAISLLKRDVDSNQITLTIADMVADGFQASREPFVMSILALWRAWTIKLLKEKARLGVSGGALLLGCLDETSTLRGHFSKNEYAGLHSDHTIQLPEVFVQVFDGPKRGSKVILGPMLLARHPSLFPSDVRVVCGVDRKELHHLKDCVVMPQTGTRDLPSMCSGGDLDGDDFVVIWDPDLIPQRQNLPPEDFSSQERKIHEGKITDQDLMSFMIDYMRNDSLSFIATSHMAQADWADEGARSHKCLELARLHSTAVDFVKTGRPARIQRDLKPHKWPHFMERRHLPAGRSYKSEKVLGKLYDHVDLVTFSPICETAFDQELLRSFPRDLNILSQVSEIKAAYDNQIRRIMAHFRIATEYEVWSTLVVDHNDSGRYKFHEKIGNASSVLKEQFRGKCIQVAGGQSLQHLAPVVIAMYQVTADEVKRESMESHAATMAPIISFPWLFPEVLGAVRRRQVTRCNDSDHRPELFSTNGSSIDTEKPEIRRTFNAVGVPGDKTCVAITAQTKSTSDLLETQRTIAKNHSVTNPMISITNNSSDELELQPLFSNERDRLERGDHSSEQFDFLNRKPVRTLRSKLAKLNLEPQ